MFIFKRFPNSQADPFVQLFTCLIGESGLCNFIVVGFSTVDHSGRAV
jgi:hypothetical protein